LASRGEFAPGGGEYISYEPNVEPVPIKPPSDESDARLRGILRTIAEGIHAGLFMQYTGQESCTYCPYDRICMGVQTITTDMKRTDPAALEFLEMKGAFKLSP
jgi:hypothetical protein